MSDIKERLKNLNFADLIASDEPTPDEIGQWIHDNRRARETPAYRRRVKAHLDRIIQDAEQALDHYLKEQNNESNE